MDRPVGGIDGGCAMIDANLTAYLEGTLRDDAVEALEAHAAICEACGIRLERATRQDLSAWQPLPSAEVRTRTLRAIDVATGVTTEPTRDVATHHPKPTTPNSLSRGRWRLSTGVGALAAAVLVTVVVRRDMASASPSRWIPQPASPVAQAPDDRTQSVQPDDTRPGDAVQATARGLARRRAQGEFDSLDTAARELQRALEATPDDREVRAWLDAVRSRRAELVDRIAEASP